MSTCSAKGSFVVRVYPFLSGLCIASESSLVESSERARFAIFVRNFILGSVTAVSFASDQIMTEALFLSRVIISVICCFAFSRVNSLSKLIFCHRGTSDQTSSPILSASLTVASLCG